MILTRLPGVLTVDVVGLIPPPAAEEGVLTMRAVVVAVFTRAGESLAAQQHRSIDAHTDILVAPQY